MSDTTLKIVKVIQAYLINVSFMSLRMYCGYSAVEVQTALDELLEHGYLERRDETVYVKTDKFMAL